MTSEHEAVVEIYKKEVSELFGLTQEQQEANNALNADMDLLMEKSGQLDKDVAALSEANAKLEVDLKAARDEVITQQ